MNAVKIIRDISLNTPQNEEDLKEYWRNEKVAFLALSTIRGIGYWKLRKIVESNLSFKELLKSKSHADFCALFKLNLDISMSWEEYQLQLWKKGLEQARTLNNNGITLLFCDQEFFPKSLLNIQDPPYWLFVQGNYENLLKKSVSVVGTRKPTEDGVLLTKILLAGLADKEIPTVSGLASGIDQAAHIESLRYNIPTVAVLGNGLFIEFPKGSNVLKEKIIEQQGTVISEYLPNQNYSRENFVRRNRIQAALCDTLVPVEWKLKSGTAHTVNYASDYQKKLAAIHLPHSASNRPEINQIQSMGGRSFCVPKEINELIRFIVEESKTVKQQILDL